MRGDSHTCGRVRRLGFWLCAASLIAITAGVSVVIGSGVASASGGFGTPVEIAGSPGGGGNLSSISCTSATICTAVGDDDNNEGMYVTESAGVWGAVTEITAGTLQAVSCTSLGNCTAVGQTAFVAGTEPLYVTESGGTWGSATQLSAPSGGPGPLIAGFDSVSCSDATDCTAVGGNKHSSIYATETGGTWGPVAVIPGSSNPDVTHVSCTSAGDCTAVGEDTSNGEPFYVTQSGGSWGAINDISTPAGDGFNSVSCTSSTTCTAVGEDSSGPFYATESGGTWGAATTISDAGGGGALYALSCSDATDCTASGYDDDGLSYATESAGTWGPMTDIAGTSADGAGNGGLYGLSCTSTIDCTAVGSDYNYEPIYTTTAPVVNGHAAAQVALTPSPLPTTTGTVTYAVTVSGAGPTPTGSVKVSDGEGGTCAITPLVSGSGSCTITESAASAPYTVTAGYSGDGYYASAVATATVTAASCPTNASCTGTAQSPSQTVTATGTTGTTAAAVALSVAPQALNCGPEFNYLAPVATLTDSGLEGSSVVVTDTVKGLPSKKGVVVCYESLGESPPPQPSFLPKCHGKRFVSACTKSITESDGNVVAQLELPTGDPRFHIGGETPSVTSYSPASAKPGHKLTIKGENLSEITSVTIGGAQATIIKTAPTSVSVTVPNGAKGGVVKVTSLAGVASGPSVTVSGTPLHPSNLKRDEHRRR